MGLFDDLLKKPTPTAPSQPSSGSSGGFQPPSDDSSVAVPMPKFVIEKSQETVIFGPDTENAKVEAQNVAPKEPTHYEENDSNSVLMATTPVAEPIKDESTIEQSPVAEPISSSILNESPIGSLIGNIEESIATPQEAPVESNAEATMEEPTLIGEAILAPVPSTDNFLASLTDTTEVQEKISDPVETPVAEAIAFETSTEKSETLAEISGFSSPKEFIEHSLESIDIMIEKIDMKHEAKIEEAEGYGNEKDRYTELEKNAYMEAETMDKEKIHTLRMRKLLEKELVLEETLSPALSRGGSLSKIKKASKKDVDEVETLVGL